jgi:SAM-dependent methyltransferase
VSQDVAGSFPTIAEAEAYSKGIAPNTSPDYHMDRVRCLSHLIGKLVDKPSRVIDFGCGDGLYAEQIGLIDSEYFAVDLSESMIQLAAKRFSANRNFHGIVGGVDSLSKLRGDADLILAIDVLAYLSDEEEAVFYRESSKLLRKGGSLIVLTGNELFDLFALNSGTVDFFQRNFDQDILSLLTEGSSHRFKNSKRKNPLVYEYALSKFGFEKRDIAFSQYHKMIPAQANLQFHFDLEKARLLMRDNQFNPNSRAPLECWKSYFDCSIFGMRFERV